MSENELQQQARALGEPTRHRIFRHIADAPAPVTVAELTDLTRLNHNAVRQHLAILRDAGLVLEEQEVRRTPGRPRLLYRANPEMDGAWGTPAPYERLSVLLTEVAAGRNPREVGLEAGRAEAERRSGAGGIEALEQVVARDGFRPTREEGDGETALVLGRCPFAAAAAAHPEVVCALHRGLADGLVEALGGDLDVRRLEVKDPFQAGCRLVLAAPPAEGDAPVSPPRARPRARRG